MRIAAVAAVALALVAATAGAALGDDAEVPCWRTVIRDWGADGSIDARYPKRCYRQALRHLDTDLRIYSNARDEIERALAVSILATKPPPGSARGDRLALWPEGRRFPEARPTVQTPLQETLTDRLDLLLERKKSPTPVPLYVLGGLALVLLASGGIGLAAGRRGRA